MLCGILTSFNIKLHKFWEELPSNLTKLRNQKLKIMKKEKLKKYALIMLMLLFTSATAVQAQQSRRSERWQPRQEQLQNRGENTMDKGQKGPRGPRIPNLTDEQKEQLKGFRVEFEKVSLPIQNQIGEKEARLKTLTTAESFDQRAVNNVIEEIGGLRTEIMKLRIAQTEKVKSILTEEQLVAFNNQIVKGHKQSKGKKRGPGQREGMHR